MFWKMVKNGLGRKSLTSGTLFLFIFMSMVTVCIGVSEVYYVTRGLEQTFKKANIADYIIMKRQNKRSKDQINASIQQWATKSDDINEYSREEIINLQYFQIDFDGIDESSNANFTGYKHYLCRQPKVHNKVYDLKNQPFELKPGEIAIGSVCQKAIGAKVGDNIRLTTDRGKTYLFKIAYIFKDVLYHIGSNYQNKRYIICEQDFEQFLNETVMPIQVYAFSAPHNEKLISSFKNYSEYDSYMTKGEITKSFVMQNIVVIIVVGVSLFLILIILLTIQFTINVALADEVKEIGMMRAIGLPEFRFKGLYLANYLFLTGAGSVLGLSVGLPIAHNVTHHFDYSIIVIDSRPIYIWTIGVTVGLSSLIVLFCFVAVRKIDKISVVNALNQNMQENKGKKQSKCLLYKSKKMSVPSYMAISDIRANLKPYLPLISAYLFAAMILLFPQHILSTIQSTTYLSYEGNLKSDFSIPYYDENLINGDSQSLRIDDKLGQIRKFSWLEEAAKKQGIYLQIDVMKAAPYSYFVNKDTAIEAMCKFGKINMEDFVYVKGSAPKHENEVAITDEMAKRYAIPIGATIVLNVTDYSEDKKKFIQKPKEFLVSGTYQNMDNNDILMSSEFDSDVYHHAEVVRAKILAPDKKKPEIIKQLKSMFGTQVILTEQEYLNREIADFVHLFNEIIMFLNITIPIIIFFLTLIYIRLMMTKETPNIVLLMQIGFSQYTLKKWQISRCILLAGSGVILGIIGSILFGQPVTSYCFVKLVNITECHLIINKGVTWIRVPMILLVAAVSATELSCRKMKNLKLSDINGD